MTQVFIYDVVRSPRGKGRAGGALSEIKPIDQLKQLYQAIERRHPEALSQVDEVTLGCVTQTGDQGANLAKISALYAGLPERVGGMTINRFCTSGLDAVVTNATRVMAGMDTLSLAGGVESMSRVPIFSDQGAWFHDAQVAKQTRFVQMGFAADLVATLEGFSREELDGWALRSHELAAKAQQRPSDDVVPILGEDGAQVLAHDELVRAETTLEWLGQQRPVFFDEASAKLAMTRYPALEQVHALHHRGNSPSLADGASLVLLGAERSNLKPRARIVAMANASVEPIAMLTAAQLATERALERANLKAQDLDLIELNEAFAAIPLKFIRDLGVDERRVNPLGGTIARGHAMGATGAMLLGTLLGELERQDKRYGLVAVSGGAGLGTAMIIERL